MASTSTLKSTAPIPHIRALLGRSVQHVACRPQAREVRTGHEQLPDHRAERAVTDAGAQAWRPATSMGLGLPAPVHRAGLGREEHVAHQVRRSRSNRPVGRMRMSKARSTQSGRPSIRRPPQASSQPIKQRHGRCAERLELPGRVHLVHPRSKGDAGGGAPPGFVRPWGPAQSGDHRVRGPGAPGSAPLRTTSRRDACQDRQPLRSPCVPRLPPRPNPPLPVSAAHGGGGEKRLWEGRSPTGFASRRRRCRHPVLGVGEGTAVSLKLSLPSVRRAHAIVN